MKMFRIQIIVFIIVLNGCKDFVELPAPQNQLISSSVFKSDATAIAALTAIYAQMMESTTSPYQISRYTGLSGDELKNYSTSLGNIQLYTNSLQAIDAPTNEIWTFAYKMIYQANSVYEGCEKSTTLNDAVKRQLMAEARFIRALWYFYLVNFYNDVPLVASTDYKANATLPRSLSSDVYLLIVDDLKYAQSNLNEDYVSLNSTTISDQRIRPNSASATALLARTYLYLRNYKEAEMLSTTLINNRSVYELVDLENVFLTNSKEAIWQLMMPIPGDGSNQNTWEGAGYILMAKPTTGSITANTTLSENLVNAFRENDMRKSKWIGKYTDDNVTPNMDYYFPFKYKVINSGTITEYSTVLRLAEQYLIRAEARLKQGNRIGAIDDLDMVRVRAGLQPLKIINPDIAESDLFHSIMKERQRELFTEWGHRWFDIKRTDMIDSIMNDVGPTKGSTWSTYQQLWPIPQSEIQKNKNLNPNNPGYN